MIQLNGCLVVSLYFLNPTTGCTNSFIYLCWYLFRLPQENHNPGEIIKINQGWRYNDWRGNIFFQRISIFCSYHLAINKCYYHILAILEQAYYGHTWYESSESNATDDWYAASFAFSVLIHITSIDIYYCLDEMVIWLLRSLFLPRTSVIAV